MPSFILIRPTVWPQYTNITDRQTEQWSDIIGLTILQRVAQKQRTMNSGNGEDRVQTLKRVEKGGREGKESHTNIAMTGLLSRLKSSINSFRPGLCSGTDWGAYNAPAAPEPLVSWERVTDAARQKNSEDYLNEIF